MEDVEPRRSLRLAKKKVTMGRLGTVDDPEVLPYYMAAVKSGYAGTRQNNPRVFSEEEDAPPPYIGEYGAGYGEYGGAVGQWARVLHWTASLLHTSWGPITGETQMTIQCTCWLL